MPTLRKFLHVIDLVSEWTGKLSGFLIIVIIIAIVWDVVLRYGFNARAVWGHSSYGKLLLFYVVFGAAYALLTHAHVNVDIVYQRFSTRVRAVFDVLTASFFFIFCIVMLLETLPHAVEQALHLKLSPRLFFPAAWPIETMIPLGLVFLLFQGLAKFVRDLIVVVTGKEHA